VLSSSGRRSGCRGQPDAGFSLPLAGEKAKNCDVKGTAMPNKDEAEGRIKEAAGDLTGDKDLKREGKVDRAEGKAKDVVEDASDKVKDVIDRD